MVAFSKVAAAASLIAVSAASPLCLPKLGNLAIFDQLHKVPSTWISEGEADKEHMIRAQIGLKQSNIPQLQAKLLDISNPKSANYGKWLSKEELDAFTAPPQENIAAVKAWLAAHGIVDVDQPSQDWIEFSVPVHKMESLLNAKYESFVHSVVGDVVPRTTKYSVPEALHSMIDMVTPTTAFYDRITSESTEADDLADQALQSRAACDNSRLTPTCMNSIYNVDYTSKGRVAVATTELIDVAASHDDFKQWASMYQPSMADFQDISIAGGVNDPNNSSKNLGEGNLDTQWAGGLSTPNPSQYLALGPYKQFTDQIANLASYLTSNSSAPSSVSTSYGGEEQYFSHSYMSRVCSEFMKAGSMGISVFFSSGDSGVGGSHETSCKNGFYAQWPASCPWTTAVGGTQFTDANNDETVAQFSKGGSSGGGFSEYFPAPDYQAKDTAGYVSAIGNQYSGMYNPQGRGYPDISLVAVGYRTVKNGGNYLSGGTSASSPAWAALVSVLNDYRKGQGKPNLGFVNPLLYGDAKSTLRDVTQGTNRGCDSAGFSAIAGWDPATGLGSMDFGKLRAIF